MTKGMRMRAVRRKDIDEEKLALAFLLLAKILNESGQAPDAAAPGQAGAGEEAA